MPVTNSMPFILTTTFLHLSASWLKKANNHGRAALICRRFVLVLSWLKSLYVSLASRENGPANFRTQTGVDKSEMAARTLCHQRGTENRTQNAEVALTSLINFNMLFGL